MKKKYPAKRTTRIPKKGNRSTALKKIAKIDLRRILVPIDFSEHSKKALRYAIPFAKQFSASITLINVIEPAIFPSDFGFGQMSFPDIEHELLEKSEKELSGLIAEMSTNVPIRSVVKIGIPFVEVTSYADDENVDLIIITTHGRTGVEHILFGSTAEKIIRKAPCPALVVRAEERDFINERV